MNIKHWMTRNPITVKPSTPVMEASQIMKENNIRRLPVVKKGKVVGMITQRNILETSPSAATSLSVHELNYILHKMTVEEVMTKDPVILSPDDSVVDALQMGHEQHIGSFPVVDDRGVLVGIVTESEIYKAMRSLLGDRKMDSVVIVEGLHLNQEIGTMSKLASIVEARGVALLGMFSLRQRTKPGWRMHLLVRTKDPSEIVADLEKAGYTIGD